MRSSFTANTFYIILGSVFVILSTMAFTLDGTNGGGDTILHYQMAHFAWKHPYLFFDHWGKPVFTILSSPFAWLGMSFLKWFNVIVTCIGCWFTYRIANKTSSINPIWVLPLYFCAPEAFNVTLSGLTEPLFGCLLSIALWLYLTRKDLSATILISFLPLSRSEGLFVVILAAVYLISLKRYSVLPWLLAGQLIITLAGAIHYQNLFWVFTEIPYATTGTIYETGSLFHFANHFPYVFGLPAVLMLAIGTIGFSIHQAKNLKQVMASDNLYRLILIYGVFFSFFVCHSVFYYVGIFNEMGLTRVIVAVMPAMVLIALEGISLLKNILDKINSNLAKSLGSLLLLSTMIFYCYGNTHFSIDYDKNIVKNADQRMISESLVPYLNKNYKGQTLFASNTMIAFYANTDLFEEGTYSRQLTKIKPNFKLKEGQVIVWDSWFSVVEEGVTKEKLMQLPWLMKDTSFCYLNRWKEPVEYVIFKPSSTH